MLPDLIGCVAGKCLWCHRADWESDLCPKWINTIEICTEKEAWRSSQGFKLCQEPADGVYGGQGLEWGRDDHGFVSWPFTFVSLLTSMDICKSLTSEAVWG